MKILRALGLGLLIIVLKFLVPEIFAGIENVLLTFFATLQIALKTSQEVMQAGAGSSFLPPNLPSVGPR